MIILDTLVRAFFGGLAWLLFYMVNNAKESRPEDVRMEHAAYLCRTIYDNPKVLSPMALTLYRGLAGIILIATLNFALKPLITAIWG